MHFHNGSNSRRNVGEVDEPTIIETLISLKGKHVESLGIVINSVATYYGKEYPVGTKRTNIMKAPGEAKRDVTINGKGYSLKSSRASPPAIVNHSTREKWLRVCKRVGVKIDMLDEMVSEYWELRTNHRIGEDVLTSSIHCPFGNTKTRQQYLKILLDYFLFNGTGSSDSRYPADYILEFASSTDQNTWRILDSASAVYSMWPKMVFSIRSKKGMPSNYPNIGALKKAQMEPWVRYINGDYRGALHVRTKR